AFLSSEGRPPAHLPGPDEIRSRTEAPMGIAPFATPGPRPTTRGICHPVDLAGVSRSFDRHQPNGRPAPDASRHLVVRDITLAVAPGEVVAILGASGCG